MIQPNRFQTIAEVDRAERQRVKLQEARNELEAKVYSVKNGLEEEEIKVCCHCLSFLVTLL